MAKSKPAEKLLLWEGQTSDGTDSWSVLGTREHLQELSDSLTNFLKDGE